MPTVRIIGPGRAGGAFALALSAVGWRVAPSLGRQHAAQWRRAARGVDLVLLAVPDGAIGEVAAQVDPDPTVVVAHAAGSLGLDVLGDHPRVGAVHPLVALPSAEVGAQRLLGGGWFAVAGDPLAAQVVADLGGRAVTVADEHRALYHGAAAVASNHLVGLLGQVARMADQVGVPLEAYLDLVRGTVDNVASLGPAAALTGPAARGDWGTIERHRAALAALPDGDAEVAAYDAGVALCRRLVAGGGQRPAATPPAATPPAATPQGDKMGGADPA